MQVPPALLLLIQQVFTEDLSGTIPGTGDTAMNQTNSLCLHTAYTTIEGDKYTHKYIK